MSKFLKEVLPKGILDAQVNRNKLEQESFDIARKLNFDDEWADHFCDCEFCESRDYEDADRITYTEREDLEKKHADLKNDIANINLEIKRMTEYKAFMEARK